MKTVEPVWGVRLLSPPPLLRVTSAVAIALHLQCYSDTSKALSPNAGLRGREAARARVR